MLRLIEQLAGDGEMLDGGTSVALSLGRVHYHLSVYQHFSDLEGEAIPASLTVEGVEAYRANAIRLLEHVRPVLERQAGQTLADWAAEQTAQ